MQHSSSEHVHGSIKHSESDEEHLCNKQHGGLSQEIEDESEVRSEVTTPYITVCSNDQFLCTKTCTCIAIENRCDDVVSTSFIKIFTLH